MARATDAHREMPGGLEIEGEYDEAAPTSTRLRLPALVRFLVEVLGQSIVQHIADVTDPQALADWASGSCRPCRATEERLRTAYRTFQTINGVDNEFAARAWLIGLNPQLDDEAPVTALRDDRLRDVIVAADAFVRTG